MYKTILLFLILFVSNACLAQTETKYYSSQSMDKEVPQAKAKFSMTISKQADGVITTELKDLKKNITLEAFRGEEPIGVWTYRRAIGTAELNYNFELKYSDEDCKNGGELEKIKKFFEDDASVGYKCPKVSADNDPSAFSKLIARALVYPVKARRYGIQGAVQMSFTITKEGNVENVVVTKGVDIVLDKEAVRVMREIKFSTPPTLNGQPVSICVKMPLTFKLA